MEEVFFDFDLETSLVSTSPTRVEFRNNLRNTDTRCFLVRPVAENTVVDIRKNDVWASAGGLWSGMPTLESGIQVMFKSAGPYGGTLSFDILDLCSGKIHRTPKQRVWLLSEVSKTYKVPSNTNIRYKQVIETIPVDQPLLWPFLSAFTRYGVFTACVFGILIVMIKSKGDRENKEIS